MNIRNRLFPLLILACLTCLASPGVDAPYFPQEHYRSPLFIDGGRLHFIQVDGTLTVIDIAGGEVLRRIRAPFGLEAQKFVKTDFGILGLSHRSLFLLAADTGGLIWAREARLSLRRGDTAFCFERWGDVVALDLRTGEDRWRQRLGEVQSHIEDDGRLYLTLESPARGGANTLVCLDAADGRELWRASPENRTWFGMRLEAGGGVSVFTFLRDGLAFVNGQQLLYTWSRDGELLAQREADDAELGEFWPWSLARPSVPEEEPSHVVPFRDTAIAIADTGLAIYDDYEPKGVEGYPLPDGGVLAVYNNRTSPVIAGIAGGRQIEFADAEHFWKGWTDYLSRGSGNHLAAVAGTADALILAAQGGQVECLDRDTGRSRWLYVFPVHSRELDRQRFFAFNGLWDWKGNRFYSDRRRDYRDSFTHPRCRGTVGATDPESPPTRLLLDPDPTDLYRKDWEFGRKVAGYVYGICAATILAPGCILLFLWKKGRLPRLLPATSATPDSTAAYTPLMTVAMLLFFAFMKFGAFSPATALALLGAIAALVGTVLIDLGVRLKRSGWNARTLKEARGHVFGMLLVFALFYYF